MKKIVRAIFCFYMSFLIMGMYSFKNSFSGLEYNLRQQSKFVENGLKLKYILEDAEMDDECNRITDCFEGYNYNIKKKEQYTNIKMNKGKLDIESNIWNENGNIYVEIVLINKDENNNIDDLYELCNNIRKIKLNDIEYFRYYKGKTKKSIINNLDKNFNLREFEILDINNGYTATAYLQEKQKVNLAEVKYDTGMYIIIATPIIFTTY